ncbi:unnamed protein product [Mytilus coruscus]|uniref:Uncharacterized protein n=1 Tax=Mytilus coruscus TaxID=42192 RepID=A0A6J8E0G3_MYTCO|nr:unnamed protein product [Mytilus coruscus]
MNLGGLKSFEPLQSKCSLKEGTLKKTRRINQKSWLNSLNQNILISLSLTVTRFSTNLILKLIMKYPGSIVQPSVMTILMSGIFDMTLRRRFKSGTRVLRSLTSHQQDGIQSKNTCQKSLHQIRMMRRKLLKIANLLLTTLLVVIFVPTSMTSPSDLSRQISALDATPKDIGDKQQAYALQLEIKVISIVFHYIEFEKNEHLDTIYI